MDTCQAADHRQGGGTAVILVRARGGEYTRDVLEHNVIVGEWRFGERSKRDSLESARADGGRSGRLNA
jgi:hypothetical protein